MRPTIMRISTDTVAANARAIRARLPEKVRMMCVVKADAYGHDAARTARKLLYAGADAFAWPSWRRPRRCARPASKA